LSHRRCGKQKQKRERALNEPEPIHQGAFRASTAGGGQAAGKARTSVGGCQRCCPTCPPTPPLLRPDGKPRAARSLRGLQSGCWPCESDVELLHPSPGSDSPRT
jgi:hypothetical protein